MAEVCSVVVQHHHIVSRVVLLSHLLEEFEDCFGVGLGGDSEEELAVAQRPYDCDIVSMLPG